MVSDYKNADGDYRGVLERYLPTAYKTIGNGSDVHRGLLGALKQMLVTTEQDIIDGTQQVFLANANSWALDLYGDWVGESRKGELDDTYRARIIEKITLGRNTVGNIIKGIKREINDPDLTVSVYEPWRNIFILNKSFLNGADRLIGKFYRYAVVQVTLNKYVNALELQMIADKYKSAGVSLVFVYREGIVAGDGTLLALPLKLITENRNTVTRNRSQLQGTLLMNGLPTGTKATDLFTVNESDLNGADVLASDPNSVYSGVYGTVPSKNIFGTTAPTAGMTSDPYDFIFQQSKVEVDASTLGGRNLLIGTNSNAKSSLNSGSGSYTTQYVSFDSGYKYNFSYTTASTNWAIYLFSGLQKDKFKPNTDYVLSFMANVSTDINPFVAFANDGGLHNFVKQITFPIISSSNGDQKVVIQLRTNATLPDDSDQSLYIDGFVNKVISFSIWDLKIETGEIATDWTPAPEDTPKIYIHLYPYTGTDYTALNRLDGVTETVTASGLPTVAFNISEYVKGTYKPATAVDYTNFSTPVSSINVNLKGSPFGLAPTTITVLSQGATPLTGKWYKNDTLISPQTTQVSDATTPTGTWSFKLDTPTLVSSVTLTDNYPDSTGAYRVITMTTTDNRELVLLNTTQQVTGTINTARLQTQTPEIYRPYIKSATIGDTTLTSPQVFDATTGHWIDITSTTELVPYITYGDITDSLYVILRNKTAQQNIDYLGLDITQVSVEGQ